MCVVSENGLRPVAGAFPNLMGGQTHIGSDRSACGIDFSVPPRKTPLRPSHKSHRDCSGSADALRFLDRLWKDAPLCRRCKCEAVAMVGKPDRMHRRGGVSNNSGSLVGAQGGADFPPQARPWQPDRPVVAQATCPKPLFPCPRKPFLSSNLQRVLGLAPWNQEKVLVWFLRLARSRG